jgi:hypothetical protein
MIRRVLMGVLVLALPLIGLAVWSGIQPAADAATAPPLSCADSNSLVALLGGPAFTPSTTLQRVPGLLMRAAPPKTLHSAATALAGATQVEVTNNVKVAPGVVVSEAPAIVNQQFKIGAKTYTITRVDTYLGGLGLETSPGKILLSFDPALSAPLASGGVISVLATTTNGWYTQQYVANAEQNYAEFNFDNCVAAGDFYPNSVSVTFGNLKYNSDSALSLEAPSPVATGSLTFPPSAGGYTNSGRADTLTFPAASVAFCRFYPDLIVQGGSLLTPPPFSVLNGKPVPNGTVGSSPCRAGTFYYVGGSVTGSYAMTGDSFAVSIVGVEVCTYWQNSQGGACDGSNAVNDVAALQELKNAEMYYDSNGDCQWGINGWTPSTCQPPNGPDHFPLWNIVGFTTSSGTGGV